MLEEEDNRYVVRLHLLRIVSTLLYDSCLSCRQIVVRLYRRAAKQQKILGFMAHSGGESQPTVGLILQTAGPPLTDSQPSVSFGWDWLWVSVLGPSCLAMTSLIAAKISGLPIWSWTGTTWSAWPWRRQMTFYIESLFFLLYHITITQLL